MGMPNGLAWSKRLENIAPSNALDEAVLMNSLLDMGGIRLTSRNLGIHIRQPQGKKPPE